MDIITTLGTILGIALVVFFRDWRDGKKLFSKNGSAESAKYIKELRDSQIKLQEHFNHETTEILKDIRDCIAETNRKLFEHTTEEKIFQRDMREFMSEIRRK